MTAAAPSLELLVSQLIEAAHSWGHHSVLRESSDDTIAFWKDRVDTLRAALQADPVAVDGCPALEQHEREALNYLGASLKDRNAKRAVDKALVLCDFYAGRNQLTFDHARQLTREVLPAAAPAVAKQWYELLARIAEPLNCLPSTFVDGNEHVVRAAQKATTPPPTALQADRAAPFGWWLTDCNGVGRFSRYSTNLQDYQTTPGYSATPLYTAPPAAVSDPICVCGYVSDSLGCDSVCRPTDEAPAKGQTFVSCSCHTEQMRRLCLRKNACVVVEPQGSKA